MRYSTSVDSLNSSVSLVTSCCALFLTCDDKDRAEAFALSLSAKLEDDEAYVSRLTASSGLLKT
jgi:hypothetical protein